MVENKIANGLESAHNIVKSSFKPAWWLKNRHLQTLYSILFRKHIKLDMVRENFTLPDGDIIALDWTSNRSSNKPILIVLHGLEGSSNSGYIRGLMQQSVVHGFRSVCLHFRGCAGNESDIRDNPSKSYHAGETQDLTNFLESLLKTIDATIPIFIVGYSLGGNVLLKWLGENNRYSERIKAAVAVSTPFELAKSVDYLSVGFSRLYTWHLLRSLRKSMLHKFFNKSKYLNHSELNKIKTLREFDNKITAPMHGFLSADDYYSKSSSKQYLSKIKTPTLIINAIDDPFFPKEALPNLDELSPSITLELTPHGGHVGFIEGNIPFLPTYYLEQRIIQCLQIALCYNK